MNTIIRKQSPVTAEDLVTRADDLVLLERLRVFAATYWARSAASTRPRVGCGWRSGGPSRPSRLSSAD